MRYPRRQTSILTSQQPQKVHLDQLSLHLDNTKKGHPDQQSKKAKTMGLQDILHFDTPGYATKIATYDDSHLCNNEVVKLRQKTGSAASIIGGGAMVCVAGPSSLISMAYGARCYNIASRKRKLIRTEMTKRGLAHHSLTTADVLIPVATSAIALGANMALDAAAASSAITQAADTTHRTAVAHTTSSMNNLPCKAGMWAGKHAACYAVKIAVHEALSLVDDRPS